MGKKTPKNMMGYYDKNGIKIDVVEWGRLFEDMSYKIIKKDDIIVDDKTYMVSTVWLGINHNFSGKGEPIIFETMIFGKDYDGEYQERYHTEKGAIYGHKKAIKLLKSGELFLNVLKKK